MDPRANDRGAQRHWRGRTCTLLTAQRRHYCKGYLDADHMTSCAPHDYHRHDRHMTHTEDEQVGTEVLLFGDEDNVGEENHEVEDSAHTRSQVRICKEYTH